MQFPGGFQPSSMPLTLAADQKAFASSCSGRSMREIFMSKIASGSVVSLVAVGVWEVKD